MGAQVNSDSFQFQGIEEDSGLSLEECVRDNLYL